MTREHWRSRRPTRSRSIPAYALTAQAALGEQHRPECKRRTRTVVMEVTIQYVLEVPEAMLRAEIQQDFCLVVSGAIGAMKRGPFTVDRIRFVREATATDELEGPPELA
jgi:hypothetical protein